MTYQIRSIQITKIEPNCRCVYDLNSIDEMIRSIRQEGQINPIKIWFTGRCFRILDGEKRWRAFKKMGICDIKAIIIEETEE
jgi:ParB family chromosome partitioning protein